jgi:hypothetical protein
MKKSALLSGASAIALVASLASSPAQAFDQTYWSWNSNVMENIYGHIGEWTNFVDPGWTQVERLQLSVGNINAYTDQSFSYASGASGHGMPIYINIEQENSQKIYQFNGDQYASNKDSSGYDQGWGWGYNKKDDGDQTITQIEANLAAQGIYAPITVNVNVPHYDYALMDAKYDLGRLEGSATAMANLASLSADVGARFHDTQVAFGSFKTLNVYDNHSMDTWDQFTYDAGAIHTGNAGHDAVFLGALEAQYGLIKKGYVNAFATADYVTNLAVQEDATAFGNLHSVSNTPAIGAERLYKNVVYSPSTVIGDLSQFNFMDVTAVASSTGQKLYGFKNLGAIDGAVSKLTATAMGNMSSVVNKVATPN